MFRGGTATEQSIFSISVKAVDCGQYSLPVALTEPALSHSVNLCA